MRRIGMRNVFNRQPAYIYVSLALLAILASLVAGMSLKISASPLSPLMVGGSILAALFGVVLLGNPTLALFTSIFVKFIPAQIIILLPVTLIANYSSVLVQSFACISFVLSLLIHHRRIVWPSSSTMVLAFISWCVISLTWAKNLEPGYQGLIVHLVGFSLLILIVNQINSLKALNGFLNTLALVNWMLVLIGMGTVLTQGYNPGTRLDVLGLNENSFGILILVSMPGVLWQANHLAGRQKISWGLIVPLYFFLVICLVAMSGSRGSAVSILITSLAFIFWRPTRAWGILALAIFSLAAVSFPFIFSTTLERFAVTQKDTLLGGREAIWQATWLLIRNHPWLGVGIGNAPYSVISNIKLFRSIGGAGSASIHNPILAVWAETGLPGILLYLSILATAAFSFFKQYHNNRNSGVQYLKYYFPVTSAVFLGYMASWIKSGGMESSYTYYLILAFLLIPSQLKVDDSLS